MKIGTVQTTMYSRWPHCFNSHSPNTLVWMYTWKNAAN